MTRRRRILFLLSASGLGLLFAAALIWRVATSREVIESVPLSTGQYNVRYLTAALGNLNYSSDDKLKAFLRKRAPTSIVRKLGEVTTVRSGYSKREHGDLPLVLLFQLLTPQNALQANTSTIFNHIELPESTGFTFTEEIRGYSSSGQGSSIHDFFSFPRRDPTLNFRLYEMNGKLLMEKSIPNPAYRSDFPVWTPAALPQTKAASDLKVTLKSLKVDSKNRQVYPRFDVETDDPSWKKPSHSWEWTDATGNVGPWLSPYEPAWKLHLRLKRPREAKFPESATWSLSSLPIPAGLTLTTVDKEQVVDGIGLRVRYVAPPAEVRDEGGQVTLNPPRSPGHTGMSTSAGSTTNSAGKMVQYHTIETGMPWIRIDHDPLPVGVELVCDVRDEHGTLLSNNLNTGNGTVNNTRFYAVYFAPGPETKTVQLQVRVSRPIDVEFTVKPPEPKSMQPPQPPAP
ncbi:MAG TPA: hypothetical protein VM452_05940 [Caulifigura sp.]|jgi:hypothetical protein|nr:hypothetical protein [Caulifigura sp.]